MSDAPANPRAATPPASNYTGTGASTPPAGARPRDHDETPEDRSAREAREANEDASRLAEESAKDAEKDEDDEPGEGMVHMHRDGVHHHVSFRTVAAHEAAGWHVVHHHKDKDDEPEEGTVRMTKDGKTIHVGMPVKAKDAEVAAAIADHQRFNEEQVQKAKDHGWRVVDVRKSQIKSPNDPNPKVGSKRD